MSLFCNQLGIDKKIVPHKRYSGAIKGDFTDLYFVDKFPRCTTLALLPPVMTFSFIDPGFESMDSFKTHPDEHLTFFTKLSQLRFFYAHRVSQSFVCAKKLLHGTFQRLWNPAAPRGLFDYFRTRRTWDGRELMASSVNTHILFMNQGKERFGNPGIENLYQRWRTGIAASNEPLRTIIILATMTGLRIGEILALRWLRIDLLRGTLRVAETCYKGYFGFAENTGKPTRSSIGFRGCACGTEEPLFAFDSRPSSEVFRSPPRAKAFRSRRSLSETRHYEPRGR